jgi:hypothetical protein
MKHYGRTIEAKPTPTRPPGGNRPDIDALNSRIENLQAELARLEMEKSCIEAIAAGHRADFERERERCDTIIAEALKITKIAMSARESAARLQGELAARQRQPWWKRVVAKPPTPWRALPSQLGETMGAVLRSLTRGRLGLLRGHRKLFIAYEVKADLALNSGESEAKFVTVAPSHAGKEKGPRPEPDAPRTDQSRRSSASSGANSVLFRYLQRRDCRPDRFWLDLLALPPATPASLSAAMQIWLSRI